MFTGVVYLLGMGHLFASFSDPEWAAPLNTLLNFGTLALVFALNRTSAKDSTVAKEATVAKEETVILAHGEARQAANAAASAAAAAAAAARISKELGGKERDHGSD